jgi:hypothetical protein
MYVYWLCYQSEQGVCVVLRDASCMVHARLAVALGNLEPGPFTEGHQLDEKMSRRIPKQMIGRCLSTCEAQQLLKRIGG